MYAENKKNLQPSLSGVDILAIDDDKISQKMISRALQSASITPRLANDGEHGLIQALETTPDIVLLDVEMPGLNGYEVCERLRDMEQTHETPIVFLSSHSSLRERLQGYEVGADDYLVKPFEPDHLIARIRVLLKYREQRKELQAQYEMAQKTAMLAMTGSSELGIAMHFLERSYNYKTYEQLTQALFEITDNLGINCCMLINTGGDQLWYSSEGSIKPLEKELIEMAEKDKRFFDFGSRTIVNYQNLSLLVKDMPLDDMESYGRLKDLFPVLLSAVDAKVNALNIERALSVQSQELMKSFGRIRTSFYYLAKNLLMNQDQSETVLKEMLQSLNFDLMRMGLEEDQEEYLLHRIDTAIEEVVERIDAGQTIYNTLSTVLVNLKDVCAKQSSLVETFNNTQEMYQDLEKDDLGGDIELF
ncbi:MAG: response regulator [Sedimenticola sp.]|nr:MAG: response regulator [Sedimenticola sp.]